MTKDIVVIILLLVFILIICAFAQWFILQHSGQMLAAAEPVAAALHRQDWPQARAAMRMLEEEWDRSQRLWKAISDHQDMRDLQSSLEKLALLLEQEDAGAAQQELQSLVFSLRHLQENERLYLENIF